LNSIDQFPINFFVGAELDRKNHGSIPATVIERGLKLLSRTDSRPN
jgi:hypothetical protein